MTNHSDVENKRIFHFAFCRLSWTLWQLSLEDTDHVTSLLNAFNDTDELDLNRYNWALGDFGYKQESNTISGRLGKYKSEVSEIVYDKSKKKFKEESHPGHAYTSFFVLDVDSNLIAFQVTSQITATTFIHRFEKLLRTSRRIIELTPIIKKGELGFLSFLGSNDVSRISMKLVLPNPGSVPEFEEIYEEIRRANAKSLKLEYNNPDGSLKAEKDSKLEKSVYMAEYGYGEIKAITMEGETFKSIDHILTTDITAELDSDLEPPLKDALEAARKVKGNEQLNS